MVSTQERARRYAALRAMMARDGYAALVITGNAEALQRGYIRYVTDWRLWGGKCFVVIPLEGDPVLVMGTGSQGHWARNVGWVADVRSVLDSVGEVVNVVTALGHAQSRIGVVGMDQVLTYGDASRLIKGLSQAELVDASVAVDDIMAVKSAEELEQVRFTYNTIAAALGRFKAALAPGRSEREVMVEAVEHLYLNGCLDGIAHLTVGASSYLRPASDRLFTEDDIVKVSLEFAGPSGHWIELAGIYSFKEPPARALRYFETSLKAVEGVRQILKPGHVGGDITRIVEETFRAEGWNVTGRGIWDGHAIGINVIRPPMGLIDSTDAFQENMVMNIHPGLLVDEDQWGVYVQDNFLVTAEGGVRMGDYRYEWHVKR